MTALSHRIAQPQYLRAEEEGGREGGRERERTRTREGVREQGKERNEGEVGGREKETALTGKSGKLGKQEGGVGHDEEHGRLQ